MPFESSVSISGNVLDFCIKILGRTQCIGAVKLHFENIPDIDLTPYYNYAKGNHQAIKKRRVVLNSNGLLSPPGGVLWVDGDLILSGKSRLRPPDLDFPFPGMTKQGKNYDKSI